MAKKIKFALEMADGEQVRNIDDLKEHFDVEKVVGYYLNGRLLTWLRDRYYENEATKVAELSRDDPQLHNKLCAIFGVESDVEEVDAEEIARRTERLNRLKQFTDDREILAKADQVAFDQEDLGDLLDEEVHDIYLCANRFTIPLSITDKVYTGIGKAIVVIRSDSIVDFDKLKINFVNVTFDENYQKVVDETKIKSEIEQIKPAPKLIQNKPKPHFTPNFRVQSTPQPRMNNQLRKRLAAISERISTPHRSNEHIKKELKNLEKEVERQRNGLAMRVIADYWQRIRCESEATSCYQKAAAFGDSEAIQKVYQKR